MSNKNDKNQRLRNYEKWDKSYNDILEYIMEILEWLKLGKESRSDLDEEKFEEELPINIRRLYSALLDGAIELQYVGEKDFYFNDENFEVLIRFKKKECEVSKPEFRSMKLRHDLLGVIKDEIYQFERIAAAFENKEQKIPIELDYIGPIDEVHLIGREQKDEEFFLACKMQRPLLYIQRRSKASKYGKVIYDMGPVAYNLNKIGYQKIKELHAVFSVGHENAILKNDSKAGNNYFIGKTHGEFEYMNLKHCMTVADQVKEIITDKKYLSYTLEGEF